MHVERKEVPLTEMGKKIVTVKAHKKFPSSLYLSTYEHDEIVISNMWVTQFYQGEGLQKQQLVEILTDHL